MIFIGDKAAVALFVEDILQTFGLGFQSITIMPHAKSGGYYALIAIDTSLEGTVLEVAQNFSLRHINTSQRNTQDG